MKCLCIAYRASTKRYSRGKVVSVIAFSTKPTSLLIKQRNQFRYSMLTYSGKICCLTAQSKLRRLSTSGLSIDNRGGRGGRVCNRHPSWIPETV